MRTTQTGSFYEVLTAAVADVAAFGYDSTERLEYWLNEIRTAADRDLISEEDLVRELKQSMGALFDRMVTRAGVLRQNPDVGRFTLQRLQPRLREELDRRILASVNLIKLNRERAVDDTVRRLAGWITSIPSGGSAAIARRPVKAAIRQALARTPYEVRRCTIDQGHKLAANINDIVAKDSGAIAGKWEQHYTRYPREIHTDRNGKIYLVRGSWAVDQGLVRPGPDGYMDEYEMPGELICCRCSYRYLFHLRQLPNDMLTGGGREALQRVRVA